MLDKEQIVAALQSHSLEYSLQIYDSVDSTNDVAKELLEQGAKPGTIIVASEQTSGRGRMHRQWQSPIGGLYFSIILQADPQMNSPPLYGLMAGCVVHESIKDLSGLSPHLKWPNDILLEGRKVSGILSELVTTSQGSFVVIGVGINVNTHVSDLADDIRSTSTSLLQEIDKLTPIEELLAAIVRRMDWWLASDPLLSKVHQVFNQISGSIGTKVSVRTDGQIIKGIARKMLEDGALLIETDSGETYEIQAGDVEYMRSEE